jgi:GNAT superfamily N-acetyltransferase
VTTFCDAGLAGRIEVEPRPAGGVVTHVTHDLLPQMANLRAHWLTWSGGPGGVDDDLAVYRSGVREVNLLNGVLRVRDRPFEDAAAEAEKALADVSWRWWVGPDSDPGTGERLVRRGYTRLGRMPVMAADLSRVPGLTRPAGLTIEQVSGRPGVEEYVDAYLAAFGFAENLRDALVDTEMRSLDSMIRLVGRVDGRVVATSAVLLGAGVAGLYWIATVPEYRGRGIGAELTTAAMRVARDHGAAVGTLQASTMGEPVYRRLGFTEVGEVVLYQA